MESEDVTIVRSAHALEKRQIDALERENQRKHSRKMAMITGATIVGGIAVAGHYMTPEILNILYEMGSSAVVIMILLLFFLRSD